MSSKHPSPSLGRRRPDSAAGAASLALDKDVNWDLKNYHFYNPYAFFNGRMAWDVAPAQVQSYPRPVADLPFYAMVKADLRPRVIAFLMASTTAIGAYFLVGAGLVLRPQLGTARRLGGGVLSADIRARELARGRRPVSRLALRHAHGRAS